ncbi:MAG: hypothetical protein IT359_09840 [Gemmatimonadaceae bacterium]|nr:hypothetical protein [Gemmatimonadaceae bacterium]
MWNRTSADPLARLLFDKYDVHVLSRPRAALPVLTVFAVRDDKVYLGGALTSLLRVPFDPPDITKGEPVLDISTTVSSATSGSGALNFLKGFLATIGGAIGVSMGAAFERTGTSVLKFRFDGCTLDSVTDAFDLENRLADLDFDRAKSAMRDDARYYIARGVHSCASLTFEALDKKSASIDLHADVAAIGDAKGALSVNKDKTITASSAAPLAYGVVLNELVYDGRRKRLGLKEARDYVHVMGAVKRKIAAAEVGGEKGGVLEVTEGVLSD